MPLPEEKRYTYADYLTWDGDVRYELIEGIPYAMASPSQAHQEILRELCGQFWTFLRDKPCELLFAPFDVQLDADGYDETVLSIHDRNVAQRFITFIKCCHSGFG